MNGPNEPVHRPPGELHPLPPGTTVAGRFTIKRILGQGGMGVVWLARDERLEEFVALKFLPPQIRSDAGALATLRRETLRSRKLSHANIIRIHDLHEPEGEAAFIAMEYVDGPTLSALRLQQPAEIFPWARLAPLLRQLCDALDYAHAEHVVHRDLKPSNLMLDSKDRLKLADFGIAALMADSRSRISASPAAGTPAYMSPQQINGDLPAPTDDIYSLGATLYELLTGTPPFYTGQILHQVLSTPPVPLQERLAERKLENAIPPDAEALVMACLAKDPKLRPQSARSVADWIGLPATPNPKSLEAMLGLREEKIPANVAPSRRFLPAVTVLVVLLLAACAWVLTTKKPPPRTESIPAAALASAAQPRTVAPSTPSNAAVTASEPPPGKEIFHEDFEDAGASGKSWQWGPDDTGQKRYVTTENGERFLRFKSEANGQSSITNQVLLPKCRALKCSLRVRIPDHKLSYRHGGASLGILWRKSSGASIEKTSLGLFTGGTNWKTIEGVFAVPASAASVLISPTFAHAVGTADFDNIEIRTVEGDDGQKSPAELTSLPPERQLDQTIRALRRLNPKFNGSHFAIFEGGKVNELSVDGSVTNLMPIRGLNDLRIFYCGNPYLGPDSELSDLSPLRGLRLTRLTCGYSKVSDLSPLQGMPLTALTCAGSRVHDLTPLKGMPLSDLECASLPDLKDLSPLRGLPLTHLRISGTGVKDLSPLAGMIKLANLECNAEVAWIPQNRAVLDKPENLKRINGSTKAEFWKQGPPKAASPRK